MTQNLARSHAESLDASDELAPLRDRFYLPPDTIYLDGNSLGLLCRDAEACALRVLDEWKRLGVAAWTKGQPPWFELSRRIAEITAPLVRADVSEMVVANSTTLNLHQLIATLFDPRDAARNKIVTDELAFPTDAYALQSQLRLHGLDPATHLVKVPSVDGLIVDENHIIEVLSRPDVAMAVLPAVIYTTGQLLDVPRITREARRRGVLIGWDLSHAIGAVPIDLDSADAAFAFWCNYKYLNAGPGATGGLYLNRRHFDLLPGLAGWFGSDKSKQFDMSFDPTFAADADRLHIGTPHILSLAPLEGSLKVLHEAGLKPLREKSLNLTRCLIELADARLASLGFTLGTPRDDARRGGHVALLHPEAARICRTLRARNVVPDFRPPNIVRLAPVPLYTRFVDCFDAVNIIERIVVDREYESLPGGREIVS